MAKAGSVAVSLGLGATILYLGAHAVTGPQGLVAYVDLQARERVLEAELAGLEAERVQLAARAGLLKDRIDVDYLDERARVLLAASDPDEIVFDLED